MQYGASLCSAKVARRILNAILSLTGRQCMDFRTGVMCTSDHGLNALSVFRDCFLRSGVTSAAFKLADTSPAASEMFTILALTRTSAFTQFFSITAGGGARAQDRGANAMMMILIASPEAGDRQYFFLESSTGFGCSRQLECALYHNRASADLTQLQHLCWNSSDVSFDVGTYL